MRELGGGGGDRIGCLFGFACAHDPRLLLDGDDARRGNEQLSRRWCAR